MLSVFLIFAVIGAGFGYGFLKVVDINNLMAEQTIIVTTYNKSLLSSKKEPEPVDSSSLDGTAIKGAFL